MKLQERNMISGDELYSDLLDKIVNLTFKPGDALSENELCATYGCTRHIVRNAFAKLKEQGLLEVYPQRGSYVSLINLDKITDSLFIREGIENNAVYAVMQDDAKCEKAIAKMRKLIELQKLTASDTLTAKFLMLDEQFHAVPFEVSGKSNVLKMLSNQYIHMRRWRNLEIGSTRNVADFVSDHETLVDAMEQRDYNRAFELMHRHLYTMESSKKAMKEKGLDYFTK